MITQRPWLSALRLFVAIMLFGFSGATALAFQGLPKDDETPEPDDDQPGLIEDGHYVSPQFDVEITWTDAWAVGDADDPNVEFAIGGNYDGPVASDPDLGDIVFLVDTASETSVLSLGFSPGDAGVSDPETWLEAMQQPSFLTDNLFLSEDAEILLLDATDDTVAILAREAAPNDDHVVYLQIVTDPGNKDYSFWVGLDMYEPDEYENVLDSIENDIEVDDDNDVFAVFSPNDILDALEGTVEPTEGPLPKPTEEGTEEATEEATEEPTEEATEEATEEPTEEGTEEATGEPTIPPFIETQTADATEAATEEPTGEASPVASPQASPVAFPGLVAEGDYVSPQHDVPVTWTSAWTLDPDTDEPVQSFSETGVDALYLTDAATEGPIVYITIENLGDSFDPAAALAAVSAPAYIQDVLLLSPDAQVALSQTTETGFAVMFVDSSSDAPFVSVLEAHAVDDDTVVFVEVRGEASQLTEDLLASVVSDIQVNGGDALTILTPADIVGALP